MRTIVRFTLVFVLLIAVGFAGTRLHVVSAQDETPVVCDSTLVTLLLVAEHDYDYLSSMVDTEMGVPNVDLGQFDLLITDIMVMMMEMMDDMSEEEAAMMEDMMMEVETMMGMSRDEMLSQYSMDMGMENGSMTTLQPGVVPGEPELCTMLREDVEAFLVAHLITEMHSMMEDGM